MKLQVIRDSISGQATLGKMFIDGVYFCHTLEDIVREIKGKPVKDWKVQGKTAIPTGKYPVIVSESQRFKKLLPEVQKVEGFTGIRIHSGNTEHDTEGCILLGLRRDGSSISQSRDAMKQFMEKIDGVKSISLEVSNAFTES